MTVRTFRDSRGVRWRVWVVVPSGFRGRDALPPRDQRVGAVDRRVANHPIDFPDRRGARTRRRPIIPGFEHGWLAFHPEDDQERRRLSPIPEGWEMASDRELEQLCERARRFKPSGKTR